MEPGRIPNYVIKKKGFWQSAQYLSSKVKLLLFRPPSLPASINRLSARENETYFLKANARALPSQIRSVFN